MLNQKRIIILIVLLIVLIPISGYASRTDNIVDELDYLSQTEITELQGLIDEAVMQYDMDIVIVITDDVKGKSSMDFADDFYDDNGYGIGFDSSGLLFLVNMEDREVWISTAGTAIKVFTDARIEQMLNRMDLSSGNWYKVCLSFVNDAKRYMREGIPQGQYSEEGSYTPYYPGTEPTFWQKATEQMAKGVTYIIALLAAVIITAIAGASTKRQGTTNFATYEEAGSFQLINTRDDYLREATTRVRINQNSSGGGGGNRSSTHRSSSGRSHGGGGRKF